MVQVILVIAGIYALLAEKLRFTKYYGLRGVGARWAGAAYIAIGLASSGVILLPESVHTVHIFGLGTAEFTLLFQLLLLFVSTRILVGRFGNAYAKGAQPNA